MVPPNPASPDAVIRSMPSTAWIFRQIAGAASAPLTAAVVGPGGTGKSTLLDAVARHYGDVGTVVVRTGADTLNGDPRAWNDLDWDQPVLVDDAHQLDPAVLDALRVRAESDATRLLVAYRPWPRPRGLSALGASLARRRSPVVVGHLDRDAVAVRIAMRVGCAPPDSLVDLVHEQTGGLPSLVELVTQALQDTGRFDPRHPEKFRRPDRVTVSASLAERLRYHLEALDPDVYALLQAMAVGAALDAELLGALLGTDPSALAETVEAALATGLLTEGGELISFIRSLVLRLIPVLRSREMQRRLAVIQLERGGSVLAAARQLLGTGASGSRVAAVLERAGEEALEQSPALAAELFAGTIEAGASPRALAARQAQALALAGDLDQALRLADQVVSDPAAPDRERGVSVAAAVLAHRGLLARSAELYRSLPHGAAGGALLAVPALIGIGALAEARAVLDRADEDLGQTPTLLAGAQMLMARGMQATITGTPTAALAQLTQASVSLEPAGQTVLLPDTPAALTAVVALQCGEFAVADSTLRRTIAATLGGRPAHARHLLLHGWTAMLRGKLDLAHRALDTVSRSGHPLEPRDELVAAALAVAVARREGGLVALSSAWRRARTAFIRYPIDLYVLQPLGELAIAAARLGEQEWVAPHLKEAEHLLEKLGNPVLWAAPLHWYQLHAALAAEHLPEAQRCAEAQQHAAALAGAAMSSPYADVLAVAAASWLDILSGEINPEEVQAAARRLHGVGLAWDGAWLAGQAATRTTDRRAMAGLLTCARALHANLPSAGDGRPPSAAGLADSDGGAQLSGQATAAKPATSSASPAAAPSAVRQRDGGLRGGGPEESQPLLSERELEVGELVLAGLTYKQIGARLFISAKTVEHHVARIRQRLDVTSRNELFDRLRSIITTS